MGRKFEFTIIVRAMGNKKMLKRTMDSLAKQTLGFQEHVQVLLIPQKESKEAEQECRTYQEAYPANVSLLEEFDIHQAQGNYLNYIQEGQYWSEDVLEKGKNLFQNAVNEISLLMEAFKESPGEGDTADYYGFAVNCGKNYREEAGKYFFSRQHDMLVEKIVNSNHKLEKAACLAEILLGSEELAILQSVKLYGKKTEYAEEGRDWYLKELPAWKEKIDSLKRGQEETRKHLLDFILAYHLIEAVKRDTAQILTEKESKTYEKWARGVFSALDDYVISKSSNANSAVRVYIFSLKNGEDIRSQLIFKKGRIWYHNLPIYSLNTKNECKIDTIEIADGKISCKIQVYHPLGEENLKFFLTNGRTEVPFVWKREGERKYVCLNRTVMQEMEYECTMSVPEEKQMNHIYCSESGSYQLIYKYDKIYEACIEQFALAE